VTGLPPLLLALLAGAAVGALITWLAMRGAAA